MSDFVEIWDTCLQEDYITDYGENDLYNHKWKGQKSYR